MSTEHGASDAGSYMFVGVGASARIAALHAQTFPDPWDARFIQSLLQLPGGVACLVERAGADAGFALARALAGEAEVLTLGVAPQARRCGLGAALLNHVLAAAAARGAQTIHLEVAADNAAARALYARAGFTETGRRPRYYADGRDALVLRRKLGSE